MFKLLILAALVVAATAAPGLFAGLFGGTTPVLGYSAYSNPAAFAPPIAFAPPNGYAALGSPLGSKSIGGPIAGFKNYFGLNPLGPIAYNPGYANPYVHPE